MEKFCDSITFAWNDWTKEKIVEAVNGLKHPSNIDLGAERLSFYDGMHLWVKLVVECAFNTKERYPREESGS